MLLKNLIIIHWLQNAIPLNNIDTSDFVVKTKYNTDKTELEKKIPNVTDFVKKNKIH